MQITVCDMCGTEKDVKKYSFVYDREMTPAGSSEDCWKTFDLCVKCLLSVTRIRVMQYVKEGKINECVFNQGLIKLIENKMKKSRG